MIKDIGKQFSNIISKNIEDILFFGGVILASAGIYAVYKPGVLIFPGLVLMVVGALAGKKG